MDDYGNQVFNRNVKFCHIHNKVSINNSGNIVAFSNPGRPDTTSPYMINHFDLLKLYNTQVEFSGAAQHGCFELFYSPDADMHEASYYDLASEFGEPNPKALGLTSDAALNTDVRASTLERISLNASGNILAVSQEA